MLDERVLQAGDPRSVLSLDLGALDVSHGGGHRRVVGEPLDLA
jgi:hypothetical protein